MTIEDSILLLFSPFLLGYCNCGCGKETKYYKNKLNKFIHGHAIRRGEECIFWKKGKYISSDGYWLILKVNHPYCDDKGYIREHRLIMEKHLGRYLNKNEEIHHIDENKLNNEISNLQLLTKAQHTSYHFRIDMSDRRCSYPNCETPDKTYLSTRDGRPVWRWYNKKLYCGKHIQVIKKKN